MRKNKQYQVIRIKADALIAGTLPFSRLLLRRLMVSHTANTAVISKRTRTKRQRNETIVIVTDKLVSAVNCPIEDGIAPFSWLTPRFLSISQSTRCRHQHKNTNRESANDRIVIVTDKLVSAVNCPTKDAIVPLSELL